MWFKTRVIGVASVGGHWVQLNQLLAVSDMTDVRLVTTRGGQIGCNKLVADCVADANADRPLVVLWCFFQLFLLMARFRPRVIISTGAAVGLLAIVVGRIFLARTIWIDSVANAETLSSSGRLAKYFAHTVVSQWEHVANENSVEYWGGSVL